MVLYCSALEVYNKQNEERNMEADFGLTQQAMNEQGRFADDAKLYVQFFKGAVQDKAKSLEEGRPVFTDIEMVKIMVPGDKGNVIERQVREQDKQRFPRQYAAFKNQEQEYIEGTPLEKWNYLSEAQVLELRHFNVRTVEQLAEMSDGNAQNFVGINKLRQAAQQYVDAAKEGAPVAQLQAELEKRDSRIAEQDETIQNLLGRIEALESKGSKKKKAD